MPYCPLDLHNLTDDYSNAGHPSADTYCEPVHDRPRYLPFGLSLSPQSLDLPIYIDPRELEKIPSAFGLENSWFQDTSSSTVIHQRLQVSLDDFTASKSLPLSHSPHWDPNPRSEQTISSSFATWGILEIPSISSPTESDSTNTGDGASSVVSGDLSPATSLDLNYLSDEDREKPELDNSPRLGIGALGSGPDGSSVEAYLCPDLGCAKGFKRKCDLRYVLNIEPSYYKADIRVVENTKILITDHTNALIRNAALQDSRLAETSIATPIPFTPAKALLRKDFSVLYPIAYSAL